jgi:PadR family transcriptional regulator
MMRSAPWVETCQPDRVELFQGTLDLIVLQALSSRGRCTRMRWQRGSRRCRSTRSLNQGTLYASLVRLDQKGWIKGRWHTTENNRAAKYYEITRAGTRALDRQTDRWRRFAGLVDPSSWSDREDRAPRLRRQACRAVRPRSRRT